MGGGHTTFMRSNTYVGTNDVCRSNNALHTCVGCVRTLGCRDGKQEFGIGRVEPNYELFLITLLHNVGRPLQQAVIDYIINACLFSCGGHRPFIFRLPCSSAAGQVDVTREFHHTLTRVINVDPHSLRSSPRYNA